MFIPTPKPSDLQNLLSTQSSPVYVATGGFKVVYKFKNSENEDEALKAVYLPPASTDDEKLQRKQLVARAKREVVALQECSHPAIVKLGSLSPEQYTIDSHDYLIYSEEFLPRPSLTSWLADPNFIPTRDDLGLLFSTLVDLIEELNSLGYLHRDIKPDNIMETDDVTRRFVVLDMGIAYKMDGTELTRGGAPGTLSYMAPELLDIKYKENMDFRCDLYSAALTVYALAVGSNPFRPAPQSPQITEYLVRNSTLAPLNSHRPDLPIKFCRIVDRCIRKKPALRYSRLAQLKDELKNSIS